MRNMIVKHILFLVRTANSASKPKRVSLSMSSTTALQSKVGTYEQFMGHNIAHLSIYIHLQITN